MQSPFVHTKESLREKGLSDKQIAAFILAFMQRTSSQLYTKALIVLTDEDMQAIENASTKEEANTKILELYKLRTGQDPFEEIKKNGHRSY